MSQINGKTYILPYYSLQNTLCFNKDLFRQCGLEDVIGEEGVIVELDAGAVGNDSVHTG